MKLYQICKLNWFYDKSPFSSSNTPFENYHSLQLANGGLQWWLNQKGSSTCFCGMVLEACSYVFLCSLNVWQTFTDAFA